MALYRGSHWATWDCGCQGEIDFMVLGNGWPDSKQIAQSNSEQQVYLLVGSMELTLELPLCAI